MRYPIDIINGLSFDGDNAQWKAVHMLIDASIEAETVDALSKDNKSEDRAWHAGRASSLIAFKTLLMNTRDIVLADLGKTSKRNDSSENGT